MLALPHTLISVPLEAKLALCQHSSRRVLQMLVRIWDNLGSSCIRYAEFQVPRPELSYVTQGARLQSAAQGNASLLMRQ